MAQYPELTTSYRADIMCRIQQVRYRPQRTLTDSFQLKYQTDPHGCKIVSKMMIHGPCGAANLSAPWELFYVRMLLCHQKGCRAFLEVQIVNNILHPTYRAACQALGLLGDDKEWEIAIQEACASAKSAELRLIFAHILTNCDVTDPSKLWTKYRKEMGHDILRKVLETVELIFVYGHGGTGKTFLWKTIISTLRSEGKIVLAVASSDIASMLLLSG
ncbi:DNA helicase [Tanacetum coccineum]